MNSELILVLLCGWLFGGLANLTADLLPQLRGDAAVRRSLSWAHYWLPYPTPTANHADSKPLTWRQPLVVIATAFLFVGVWLLQRHQPAHIVALMLLYSWFLLVISVIDFEQRRVLNIMLAPAAIALLLFSFVPGTPEMRSVMVGGLVGFGLFFLLYVIGRGRMGAGDVKFAGVIGLMIGYPSIWTALAIGIIAGGVAALFLLASKRVTRKSQIAYAPYLAAGAFIVLLTVLGA